MILSRNLAYWTALSLEIHIYLFILNGRFALEQGVTYNFVGYSCIQHGF